MEAEDRVDEKLDEEVEEDGEEEEKEDETGEEEASITDVDESENYHEVDPDPPPLSHQNKKIANGSR